MKKFLVAFDGLRFSESAMQYALYVAKGCNAHLVGIFMEDFARRSYGLTEVAAYQGTEVDRKINELDEKDHALRQEQMEYFEQACQQHGLNYTVHRDGKIALYQLLHESIYADLLVISAEESMTRIEQDAPTRLLRDLLTDVQCPVLVSPQNFKPFTGITILYNGSPSSVYAARNFSYIFQEMRALETEVLTVKPERDSLHLPDNHLIRELAKRHFPNAEFTVLKGEPEDEIIKYLQRQKKETLVVLGAYQRNRLSRLFKPSMADTLMMYLKKPLFIAHNKS